jgi:hypothetical protein
LELFTDIVSDEIAFPSFAFIFPFFLGFSTGK